jgi:hypothetical protein
LWTWLVCVHSGSSYPCERSLPYSPSTSQPSFLPLSSSWQVLASQLLSLPLYRSFSLAVLQTISVEGSLCYIKL